MGRVHLGRVHFGQSAPRRPRGRVSYEPSSFWGEFSSIHHKLCDCDQGRRVKFLVGVQGSSYYPNLTGIFFVVSAFNQLTSIIRKNGGAYATPCTL